MIDSSKLAVVTRRLWKGVPTWGFDAPEGFAPLSDRWMAESACEKYNKDGEHNWIFFSIHQCPKVLRVKNENLT